MNTRGIKARFISALDRFKPSQSNAKIVSQRSAYLTKMALLQAQNSSPRFVLIQLLKDYALDFKSDEKNIRFVMHLINIEKSLADNTSDYVLSVIYRLNKHYHLLAKDDLYTLFSVFFSLYLTYQMNLDIGLKAALEATDIYEDFFANELNLMVLEAESKQVRLSSKQLPENFPETKLVKEISRPVLLGLLKNITHNDSRIKTRARDILMLARGKIAENDKQLIIDKLLSLMKPNCKSTYYAACILLPVYFDFFKENEQNEAIDFLCRIIKLEDFLNPAGLALIQLAKQKVQIDTQEVAGALVEKVHINAHCRYKALDILLQLRQAFPDCLPGFVDDTLKEYLSGHHRDFGIERLKVCWKWLTDAEKENIADHLFQHCESDQWEHKDQIIKYMLELRQHWLPSEKHMPVFSRLLECLQMEACKETAMQVLSKVCVNIPLNQQAFFVDYLLVAIKEMNKQGIHHRINTVCFAILALAKLSHAIPKTEHRWVVENSVALLKSHNVIVEAWACKSIAELVDIVPVDLHQPLANRLMEKLNWINNSEMNHHVYTSNTTKEAATALGRLEVALSPQDKQHVAIQLFDIICNSKVAQVARLASIEALFPYLGCLDSHQTVAMLNRLMVLENKTGEHLKLFLHLHKNYEAVIKDAFLNRAITATQDNLTIHVPPELVQHIRHFMR